MKKTILVMVFFSLSNFLLGSAELVKDTIIINGVTIEIQLVEEEFEDAKPEFLAEDTIPKEKRPLPFKFAINQGISFNSIEAADSYISLDEFIDSNPVSGKYSSISVSADVLNKNRFSMTAGLNYTSWSQEYYKLNDQLSDSLFEFYSPFKEEFCQVTLIRTELGEEKDTLALNIILEEYQQSYIELSTGVNYNLLNPKKRSSLNLGALVISGLLVSSNSAIVSALRGKDLREYSTNSWKENTINVSVQGTLSYEIPISSSLGFFVQSGYRKNISNIFKEDTPLKISRNTIFLGLGAKIIF